MIVSYYSCVAALLAAHDLSAPSIKGLNPPNFEAAPYGSGGGLTHGTNSARRELIHQGNSMLHLHLAAFGAVVAANIVAVLAIAVMIKCGRYWPLSLWSNV